MNDIIKRITELSTVLKTLTPMKEENQQKLDRKFRLEFNYNTNHLEGNTLTYDETELLLIFDDTEGRHSFREYEEMKAHDVAYALIKEWAADKDHTLTEANIKNLNQIILVRPFWKDAITSDGQNTRRQIKVGDYKSYPNSVRLTNGEIFDYASPSETPIKMGELMAWHRQQEEEGKLHPVELAALFHYKFVCIHPFDDGNGRISRLLTNYVLLRNDLPPVIIKSDDKKNYLQALHLADVGDEASFVNYIAEQLVWSLTISIKAARGQNINEPGDLDKRLTLLKNELSRSTNPSDTREKDANSLRNVIENTIQPLALAWEEKLKEFDSFFFSRTVSISFDGKAAPASDFGTALQAAYSVIVFPQLEKGQLFVNATLSCRPNGIRQLAREVGLSGGEIQFFFGEYTYEVKFSGSESIITKFYYQQLNEKEISDIVDGLRAILLSNLEFQVEMSKKNKNP
jgi:Fic family protein